MSLSASAFPCGGRSDAIGRLADTRPWLWRQINPKAWLQKQRRQTAALSIVLRLVNRGAERQTFCVRHAQDLSNRGNGMASALGTWLCRRGGQSSGARATETRRADVRRCPSWAQFSGVQDRNAGRNERWDKKGGLDERSAARVQISAWVSPWTAEKIQD